MSDDTKPALRPEVADAIRRISILCPDNAGLFDPSPMFDGCKVCLKPECLHEPPPNAGIVIAELERLAAENAALKGKGCRQCGVAAADMVTDTYCAACRVEELKADSGWWASKCEQLQSAVATLRSQLSRIDYAFGEPNEMRCSPYDVDLDGERVVRQVEAILKPLPQPPTEDK